MSPLLYPELLWQPKACHISRTIPALSNLNRNANTLLIIIFIVNLFLSTNDHD